MQYSVTGRTVRAPFGGAGANVAARKASVACNAGPPAPPETYQVNLPKPIGVKFGRGNDGSAYVIRSEAALGNIDDQIMVGDKVVKISASFGTDVWEAKNFGQVMYAIKTRNGDVFLELEKKNGDMSAFEEKEMTDAERLMMSEKNGGNYGAGTKEIQQRNYIASKEAIRKRKEMFDDALGQFRAGKIDDALVVFEEVKALEPAKYIGDSFERVSKIYIVTLYNIACCYSMLGSTEPALEALDDCMGCGFEDYAKIRSDPNLAAAREDENFKSTIEKYDEPLLNENAVKALKSLFSFGKK